SESAELDVIDELGDRRVLTTDRAGRILPHFDRLQIHLECVVDLETSDERIARTDEELHRFRRLDRTDRRAKHAENSAFGAGRNHPGRRRFGIETAIARTLVGPEHRRLSLEAED